MPPLLFGVSFGTLLGVSAAWVAVQDCPAPHAYPLGQQPPPRFAAQLLHPVAQLPEPEPTGAAPIPFPVGAMTVTLFVFTTVVEAVAGQSDNEQSRP